MKIRKPSIAHVIIIVHKTHFLLGYAGLINHRLESSAAVALLTGVRVRNRAPTCSSVRGKIKPAFKALSASQAVKNFKRQTHDLA